MGVYKQKMLEEMEDEVHTDEYGAFMDNDEDDDSFDEDCEERAIEKSIEDELQTLVELEADLSTVQKAAYTQMSEGKTMAKERISIIKSILSDYKRKRRAKAPKTMGYDNDELVEVILNLQKKAEKDNG